MSYIIIREGYLMPAMDCFLVGFEGNEERNFN